MVQLSKLFGTILNEVDGMDENMRNAIQKGEFWGLLSRSLCGFYLGSTEFETRSGKTLPFPFLLYSKELAIKEFEGDKAEHLQRIEDGELDPEDEFEIELVHVKWDGKGQLKFFLPDDLENLLASTSFCGASGYSSLTGLPDCYSELQAA